GGIDRPKTAWTCDNLYKNRAIFESASSCAPPTSWPGRDRRVFRQLPPSVATPIDCLPAGGLLQFDEREAVGPGLRRRLWPAPMKILTCNSNRPLAEAI